MGQLKEMTTSCPQTFKVVYKQRLSDYNLNCLRISLTVKGTYSKKGYSEGPIHIYLFFAQNGEGLHI